MLSGRLFSNVTITILLLLHSLIKIPKKMAQQHYFFKLTRRSPATSEAAQPDHLNGPQIEQVSPALFRYANLDRVASNICSLFYVTRTRRRCLSSSATRSHAPASFSVSLSPRRCVMDECDKTDPVGRCHAPFVNGPSSTCEIYEAVM